MPLIFPIIGNNKLFFQQFSFGAAAIFEDERGDRVIGKEMEEYPARENIELEYILNFACVS